MTSTNTSRFDESSLSCGTQVQRLRPSFFKIRHANIVRTDPVLAGPFGQGAPQVRFPGTGEPLEHDVLAPLDETAGPQLGDHVPIQAAFIDPIELTQVGCRVAQPGPADESLDFGVIEYRMGFIDDQSQPFVEAHSHGQILVLGLECLQQG
ncbi:hypothetical protein BAUR9175_03767, partial [Brevibacterium aurantiacum]